jgi:hypothetical protein
MKRLHTETLSNTFISEAMLRALDADANIDGKWKT